jgi:hypothetical protein
VISLVKQVEDGIYGGEARREDEGMRATLELRKLSLENRSGGVVGSRVLVAAVLAGGGLSVRARLVDRRHDGARLRVWLNACVNHLGLKRVLWRHCSL